MHAHSCGRNHQPTGRSIGLRSGIREVLCHLRQWRYPPEFRIAARRVVAPAAHPEPHLEPPAGPEAALPTTDSAERPDQTARLDRSIAKVAVCLWEIRRKLEASDTAQQDRKLRLLNRRAEAAVTALEDVGVEIDDPIGRRYVPGSEASMTPHFEPTPGTTTEQIVQTIAPVVYRDKRLIGQGEVFVAIPASANDMTSGETTTHPTKTVDRGDQVVEEAAINSSNGDGAEEAAAGLADGADPKTSVAPGIARQTSASIPIRS